MVEAIVIGVGNLSPSQPAGNAGFKMPIWAESRFEMEQYMIERLNVLKALKAFNKGQFEKILHADYGIDRKVKAININGLKELMPGRACGIGISASKGLPFLRVIKAKLEKESLSLEKEFPAIETERQAFGGGHWLDREPMGNRCWEFAAYQRLNERLGLR